MSRPAVCATDSAEVCQALERVPPGFVSDGCSNAPDRILSLLLRRTFDLRPLCELHDAAYCTRANPPGSMTYGAKVAADYELGRRIRELLPWHLRWAGYVYRSAVLLAGGFGSWDSCGDEPPGGANEDQVAAGLCRHGIPRPAWMERAA